MNSISKCTLLLPWTGLDLLYIKFRKSYKVCSLVQLVGAVDHGLILSLGNLSSVKFNPVMEGTMGLRRIWSVVLTEVSCLMRTGANQWQLVYRDGEHPTLSRKVRDDNGPPVLDSVDFKQCICKGSFLSLHSLRRIVWGIRDAVFFQVHNDG